MKACQYCGHGKSTHYSHGGLGGKRGMCAVLGCGCIGFAFPIKPDPMKQALNQVLTILRDLDSPLDVRVTMAHDVAIAALSPSVGEPPAAGVSSVSIGEAIGSVPSGEQELLDLRTQLVTVKAVAKEMREALERIVNEDDACRCDCDDEYCCLRQKAIYCARCIAKSALIESQR